MNFNVIQKLHPVIQRTVTLFHEGCSARKGFASLLSYTLSQFLTQKTKSLSSTDLESKVAIANSFPGFLKVFRTDSCYIKAQILLNPIHNKSVLWTILSLLKKKLTTYILTPFIALASSVMTVSLLVHFLFDAKEISILARKSLRLS